MLAKLLKYEIKATARLFLPLYLALLLFAFINRVVNPFKTSKLTGNFNIQATISTISAIIYFALIVGIVVMTLIILIQRFYKNLLGDEGYLMFTLPVKTWQLIASKLLSALMWVVLSFTAVLTSVFILIGLGEVFSHLPLIIRTIKTFTGSTILCIIPFYALVVAASNIIMIYTAISLGHLFERHKILASFGMYAVLYLVNQIISALMVVPLINAVIVPNNSIGFLQPPKLGMPVVFPSPSNLNIFILSVAFILIVLSACYLILINYILNKKLNLD
jgi:hypothetical protein